MIPEYLKLQDSDSPAGQAYGNLSLEKELFDDGSAKLKPVTKNGRKIAVIVAGLNLFFYFAVVMIGNNFFPTSLLWSLVIVVHAVFSILLMAFAVIFFLHRKNYSDGIFEMSHCPATLGGAISGTVFLKGYRETEKKIVIRLNCFKNKSVSGLIKSSGFKLLLWQDEYLINATPIFEGPFKMSLPIFFPLPKDQPESKAKGFESVHWQLEISSELSKPIYMTSFEIPVLA